MKNLIEAINEELIVEAAAKNVHMPRKGSTVYLLKDGDNKAIPVKIVDVKKEKMYNNSSNKSYIIHNYLSDNAYDITDYTEYHFNSIEYKDENEQVKSYSFGKEIGTVYIGVSKEIIQTYINSNAANKLPGILKQIEKLQSELNELMSEKEKLEAEANLKINESLNTNKYK